MSKSDAVMALRASIVKHTNKKGYVDITLDVCADILEELTQLGLILVTEPETKNG